MAEGVQNNELELNTVFQQSYDDDDFQLSQAVQMYELSQSDLNDQEFGNFDIQNWCLEAFPELKQETFTERPESTTTRFGKPVSATEISALQKNQESKNTRRNTSWAIKVFNEWKIQRNQQQPDFKIIPEILKSTYQELAYSLSCFVIEARRADGSPYPPRTLYQICSGILRYMREEGVHDMNFLDVKDARFHDFRKTLDARMKELASQGIGVSIKQADPLTPEQEDVLWEKKLLGSHTSKSYINTVFYYNCKLFGLRGLDEHRKLEVCQIKCGDSDGKAYIEFCGRTSKNFSGGLHQRNILAKTIRHYSESGTLRSLFDVYSSYISLVGEGSFYRRPLPGPEPRFGIQPIGVSKLGTIIKTMCAEAGFLGNFSNHSGKRTCATTLFQSGFEEQQIMERTGHRSSAVRTYKRQSEQQLLEVSRALEPPQKSIKQCDDEKENAIIPKPEPAEHDGKENSAILPKHPQQDVRIPMASMGDKVIRFENCSVSMSFL